MTEEDIDIELKRLSENEVKCLDILNNSRDSEQRGHAKDSLQYILERRKFLKDKKTSIKISRAIGRMK